MSGCRGSLHPVKRDLFQVFPLLGLNFPERGTRKVRAVQRSIAATPRRPHQESLQLSVERITVPLGGPLVPLSGSNDKLITTKVHPYCPSVVFCLLGGWCPR